MEASALTVCRNIERIGVSTFQLEDPGDRAFSIGPIGPDITVVRLMVFGVVHINPDREHWPATLPLRVKTPVGPASTLQMPIQNPALVTNRLIITLDLRPDETGLYSLDLLNPSLTRILASTSFELRP